MEEVKKIRLMIKEPNKPAYVTEMEDTLQNMQKIVGGMIDCVQMPNVDNVDIFFNDEGKLEQLDGNVWLAGTGDCIVGTIYMVGYDEESGDSVSLTDKQIKECEKYIKTFSLPEGMDLYADYFLLVPIMYDKSEKYLNKSLAEM